MLALLSDTNVEGERTVLTPPHSAILLAPVTILLAPSCTAMRLEEHAQSIVTDSP